MVGLDGAILVVVIWESMSIDVSAAQPLDFTGTWKTRNGAVATVVEYDPHQGWVGSVDYLGGVGHPATWSPYGDCAWNDPTAKQLDLVERLSGFDKRKA